MVNWRKDIYYALRLKYKIKAISRDTHQLLATPLHHTIDTIVRQKRTFKYDIYFIQKCRHLASLACVTAWPTCLAYVDGIGKVKVKVFVLNYRIVVASACIDVQHSSNSSLVGKLCLRDDTKAAFV